MSYSAVERVNVFTVINVYRELVKEFFASKKKGPFPKIMFNPGRQHVIYLFYNNRLREK